MQNVQSGSQTLPRTDFQRIVQQTETEYRSKGLSSWSQFLAIRFTCATNGQGIYGIDIQAGTEGDLPHYSTPDELWNLNFAEANAWLNRFAAVPFEDKGGSHIRDATTRTLPSNG